jgi:hypothetical protein
MKTLIISGSYKVIQTADNERYSTTYSTTLKYNVTLFGQSDEQKECVYITSKEIICNNYNVMIEECKKIYCDYLKVDDYNIITLENLIHI